MEFTGSPRSFLHSWYIYIYIKSQVNNWMSKHNLSNLFFNSGPMWMFIVAVYTEFIVHSCMLLNNFRLTLHFHIISNSIFHFSVFSSLAKVRRKWILLFVSMLHCMLYTWSVANNEKNLNGWESTSCCWDKLASTNVDSQKCDIHHCIGGHATKMYS